MVKVCHVTSVHTSKDPRIFYKMCTSLARNGYDVYHIAPGESREENDVHVIGSGEKPSSRIKRMTKFTKEIYTAAIEVDADIYHLHDPELLPYAKKLKKQGKIVIFDSHEDVSAQILEKEWIPSFLRKVISYCYRVFERNMIKKVDSVICVSPNYIDYFAKYNKCCIVVSNFPIVNPDIIFPSFENNNLVFAGAINDNWSQKEILNALSFLKDYHVKYNLLGSISDSYLNELKQLSGWEYVNYYGKIPHVDVPAHLTNSYLGIVLHKYTPNVAMTFGTLGNTKLFECLSLGLPVICTDFVLWKEIVDKYKCGIYIPPNNHEALVGAVIKLVKDKDLVVEMSKNARRAVVEEYNWNYEELKMIDLYIKLVESIF